jgi:hypothetical protein
LVLVVFEGALRAVLFALPDFAAVFLGVARFAVFFKFSFFVADFLAIKSCPPEKF